MSAAVNVRAALADAASQSRSMREADKFCGAESAVAELQRTAEGLLVSMDLKHPAAVINNWRRSLRAALKASGVENV